jgi:hypothetical protein
LRILFVGKNFSQGLKDSDSSSLDSTARELGHQVVASLEDYPEILICVDYKRTDMKIIDRAKKMQIPTTLIICEPEVVIPQQARKSLRRRFDRVLEIGRPETIPQLKWAQTWRSLDREQARSKSAVMINADKWSFITGNLYWLRAAVASESHDLDVFGHGWDRKLHIRLAHRVFELLRTLVARRMPSIKGINYILSKPLSLKGAVLDKVEQMTNYRVALVIENSQELLTEKLFDAWFAGCVPVYVGPSVKKFGIPSELVVECEPNKEHLKASIRSALNFDRTQFLNSLEQFLASSAGSEWQANNAIKSALEAAIVPHFSN